MSLPSAKLLWIIFQTHFIFLCCWVTRSEQTILCSLPKAEKESRWMPEGCITLWKSSYVPTLLQISHNLTYSRVKEEMVNPLTPGQRKDPRTAIPTHLPPSYGNRAIFQIIRIFFQIDEKWPWILRDKLGTNTPETSKFVSADVEMASESCDLKWVNRGYRL